MKTRAHILYLCFGLLLFAGVFLGGGMVVASLLDAPLVPGTDNSHDVGLSSPERWRNAWFSGTLSLENPGGGTAQIGVGTTTPHASAILDVFSTAKGILFPRMTTAERDAISSPEAGLLVYNSSTNEFNRYDGTSWAALGGVWNASGTDIYSANTGNIGIGTATPPDKLSLSGGTFLQTVTTSSLRVAGALFDATNFQQPHAIAVSGRYAYTASEICGPSFSDLTVTDITNPALPVVVGSVNDNVNLCGVSALAVSGRYAYAVNDDTTSGHATFAVIDISNPHAPQVVGAIVSPSTPEIGRPQNIAVSGRYAYVSGIQGGSGEPQFIVIDVVDPTAPKIVGFKNDDDTLSRIEGIAISGKYAYTVNANLFDGTANFVVLDVSNPTSPQIVGTLDDDVHFYNPEAIALAGRYVYSVSSDNTVGKANFTVTDISDPTTPEVVASIDDDTNLGFADYLVVAGRYAYAVVTDDTGGQANLVAIDITNPLAPRIVGTLDDDTHLRDATALALSGRYAYVVNSVGGGEDPPYAGFAVVDVSGLDVGGATIGSLEASDVNILGTLQADKLHIATGVNIGTGGVWAGGPLSVSGRSNGTSSALSVSNANGTPLFYVQDDGKVGIGTSVPSSTLHIVGGYLQIEDNNPGSPPAGDCDSDTERGRWSMNTASSSIYFCTGIMSGWQRFNLND